MPWLESAQAKAGRFVAQELGRGPSFGLFCALPSGAERKTDPDIDPAAIPGGDVRPPGGVTDAVLVRSLHRTAVSPPACGRFRDCQICVSVSSGAPPTFEVLPRDCQFLGGGRQQAACGRPESEAGRGAGVRAEFTRSGGRKRRPSDTRHPVISPLKSCVERARLRAQPGKVNAAHEPRYKLYDSLGGGVRFARARIARVGTFRPETGDGRGEFAADGRDETGMGGTRQDGRSVKWDFVGARRARRRDRAGLSGADLRGKLPA